MSLAMLADRDDQAAAAARPGRAAAIFVDIVAIMIDEGELLAREMAVGGVRPSSQLWQPATPKRSACGLAAGERQGPRPAVDAALAAGTVKRYQ